MRWVSSDEESGDGETGEQDVDNKDNEAISGFFSQKGRHGSAVGGKRRGHYEHRRRHGVDLSNV